MSVRTLSTVCLCIVLLCSVGLAQAEKAVKQIDDAKAQKITMADMRSIGTAVSAFGVDNGYYPKAVTDYRSLKSQVEPIYIKFLPEKDGWGRPFVFEFASDGSSFTVISYCRDGVKSGPSTGQTSSPDDDIIFKDGVFVAGPEVATKR